VRRDLALVVDESLAAQAVVDALVESAIERVADVRLFDVYRGSGLPPGKKSLAILVLMQDTERTLTDPEIDAIVARMVRIIGERFGGSLRQQELR
jgi:phenylalanyl-tRNA synthetase beta chain